jgi:RNA-directed DNA polymerase
MGGHEEELNVGLVAGISSNLTWEKPETFNFLGFTHFCGTEVPERAFHVWRKKRLRAMLLAVKLELLRRRHLPIPQQGAWLRSAIQGYYQYHAIPGNNNALSLFRRAVLRYWLRALRRRSQRHRMNWTRFGTLANRWIPNPKILHPYPNERFFAKHPK